jgi:uncharacterized phage-associated protein
MIKWNYGNLFLRVPPYDARAIANYFLELAKRDVKTLDLMKIQKLVYLAHGWSLAISGKPLITDKVEAWKYGPVIRSIYREFAHAGSGPIKQPAFDAKFIDGKLVFSPLKLEDIGDPENENVKRLLNEVWKAYGGYSGIQLSNYTHEVGSPWADTWRSEGGIDIIPDALIKTYFEGLAAQAHGRS